MSDEEQRAIEFKQNRAVSWEKAAKGRGNRWRMMRDIVAALAMRPMNLMMTQRAMMRLRGLTRAKTHEMMSDLEDAGDIKPISGKIGDVELLGWAATDKGVHFWLGGSRLNIPVSIVQVLPILTSAPKLEESQNDHDI